MNTKKRRRSEGGAAELETPPARICRITYHVDERVFDRVFNEEDLDEMKDIIRRKLRLLDAELELTQLRDGTEVDLEDDDDFASLQAQAQVDNRIDVLVTVLDAPADWSFSRSATPAPETFERGRSVEPVAATRRRSVSFGGQNRVSLPAVANLMRAKNLIPFGATVFHDDADDPYQRPEEEPTMGELANQVKKRLSAGAQDVVHAASKAAAAGRDAGEKALDGVERAGKKAAGAAKAGVKAAKESSFLRDAIEPVAGVAKSAVKAGKVGAAVVQEVGETTADAATGIAKAAKRTMQSGEEEPPAKRRKKKHARGDADASMTDDAPPTAVPATSDKAIPKAKNAQKNKNHNPASSDAPTESATGEIEPTRDISEPKPPAKKHKESAPDKSFSSAAPMSTLAEAPSTAAPASVDLSSLDPVARILAREAQRQKNLQERETEQVKQRAAKKAKTRTKEDGKEPKVKKAAKKAQLAELAEKSDDAGASEQIGADDSSNPAKKGEPVSADKGGVGDLAAAGGEKEKKKRGRKPKSGTEGATVAPAMNGADFDSELRKTKRAIIDVLQDQSEPESAQMQAVDKPKSKQRRPNTICEVVIDVPARRVKKGEQPDRGKTIPAKKIPTSAVPQSEERIAEEEEIRRAVAVDDNLDNEETPTNITNTPRSSAFLDRLVQASTPARPSPRRSPVNSLGFPAQLLRERLPSSGSTSTSTPRRFQEALAQAVTTSAPGGTQDEIAEFTQPSASAPKSLRKVLDSPFAPNTTGKALRPLSKLPRPSLSKPPTSQDASPSPTGPPVPSPTAAGLTVKAAIIRPPTLSPSLGRPSVTPRGSPLPTWTPLAPGSSPPTSGVEHGASQFDQLRSSSDALAEMSRPNSAVTRDEEMEVERATQEDRFEDDEDDEDVDGEDGGDEDDAPPDVEMEGATTDERTRADDEGSDREDETSVPADAKSGVLGPPAQITGASDDLIGPDAVAAHSLLDFSNPTSVASAPKQASQPAQNSSARSSQQSKHASDSSLISYPSIPTPNPASQPLFRPETQVPSQSQSLAVQAEEPSIFSRRGQYVGLSQLSKEKLRQSLSRPASSSQGKSGAAAATPKGSAKRREPESETEDEEDDDDDDDDDDSDIEESIIPRDRMAGAKKARRGRVAAKFF
ncbi:hypothetical protein CALVIDRAFT_596818 [Calocera viscosa TUFC12733]|uniref:Uncharacterized protein n=1 Tax=Calocera viscosa (strain TUFC12733) TaxID=1330018 RepID=A0A167NZW2_CALVF|nr:hypothetical protein CALVIDRAFT_596818 [Calocera viscosa TUFC12733]